MSSATPIELNATTFIENIEQGAYPREVLQTVAAGFLPLPQEELVAVLAYLALRDDAEIAASARRSLADMPSRILTGMALNDQTPGAHLDFLARATDDPAVLEALIRNRSLSDATVVQLAATADAAVQEVIVINQARILRAPEILDALLANPRLSPEARRRALETREEFFDKAVRREVADDEIDLTLPVDAIADLLEKAPDEEVRPAPPPALAAEILAEVDPDKLPIYARILTMSVKEKVLLAFRGGRTERQLLVRDRNKLVCSAVMRNPRMSESEVELIAGMRNVDEEVLRLIGVRRDWVSKPAIMTALSRNPKTPVGVVLPLINRLTLRDLKGLKDDKGVTEVVRATARKLFAQRSQKP